MISWCQQELRRKTVHILIYVLEHNKPNFLKHTLEFQMSMTSFQRATLRGLF